MKRRVIEATDPEGIRELLENHGTGETYFTIYRGGKNVYGYNTNRKVTVNGKEFECGNIGQTEPIRKAFAQMVKSVAEEEGIAVQPRTTTTSLYQQWADEHGCKEDKDVLPGLTIQMRISSKLNFPARQNTRHYWRRRNMNLDLTFNIGVIPSQWTVKSISGSVYIGEEVIHAHNILRKLAWRVMEAMGINEIEASKCLRKMEGEKDE